jgi:hypothetical protein
VGGGSPANRQPPTANLFAVAILVALTHAFTWPLAPNLDRAVADPGDPLINIWILDWDWWATLHQPLSLFQANAFHPAKASLAYSENLYGIAVLLFPLRAFGVGPVAAYNLAMIAGIAFCGFGAYLLGFISRGRLPRDSPQVCSTRSCRSASCTCRTCSTRGADGCR